MGLYDYDECVREIKRLEIQERRQKLNNVITFPHNQAISATTPENKEKTNKNQNVKPSTQKVKVSYPDEPRKVRRAKIPLLEQICPVCNKTYYIERYMVDRVLTCRDKECSAKMRTRSQKKRYLKETEIKHCLGENCCNFLIPGCGETRQKKYCSRACGCGNRRGKMVLVKT